MLIGIVADDLTGAADSVAPFASRGLRADVGCPSNGNRFYEMPESDAGAWTTETRDIPLERQSTIMSRTRDVTRRLKVSSPSLYYKKVDSTLRGHLRWELDAMRMELPGRIAVVCPAFPDNGRTVQNGVLRVHGEPRQSVRAAFAMQDDPTATEMNMTALRDPRKPLIELWEILHGKGVQTVFCDAESPQDLDSLASAIVQAPAHFLSVGSAGLSAALARRMLPEAPVHALPPSLHEPFRQGKVIVIVGSLHPVSRQQAQFLAQTARLDPIVVGNEKGHRNYTELIQQKFGRGERIVLVQTTEEAAPQRVRWIKEAMRSIGGMRVSYSDLCLILTGGDTAAGVLSKSGGGMKVVGEQSPGVVVSELYNIQSCLNDAHGMPVIVKAGGFGTETTLARCVGL